VGFDDIEPARWCGPALTTVRQPFAGMGNAAAEMVLALAAGQTVDPARVELATSLVVRDSTAPPA
jgi:LacI family xylobiose transport system transcriptional regulator